MLRKFRIESFHMHHEDREFFESELSQFLPDRIFDAHCHLWHQNHFKASGGVPPTVGFECYENLMQEVHHGKCNSGLLIGWPCRRDKVILANKWIEQQYAKAVNSDFNYRGLFLVRPDDEPEWVRQEVKRMGFCGLKCYHTLINDKCSWEAKISDYLPEPIVKIANQENWIITLHIVRSQGVADANNIYWIRYYCQKYPYINLILAHSARGLQPSHNLKGLPELTGLDNLYFDTSANCEPIAHQAILRIMGHNKLLYGTDFPASHLRGRSVAVADSFLWLNENSPVWKEKHTNIKPVLLGLEHLRSLKWACWSEKLTDSQVEDIFWNNAARLFNLK